jgi:ABC-2 type transport system ATP-binding protein
MTTSMVDEAMIEAEGLTKRYGSTQALAGVDFAVPAGTILGLLGPNGAGKTTAVRILTTMAIPDSGRGRVAGIDVVKHPGEVRRHIGVAAQDATLDPLLTGRQNLVLVGELSDMGRSESRARAKELLAQFELTDAADRVLKGYSGGMRRRLDLAASLMTRPPVLFLDEPTTGLDPVSRQRVWDAVRDLLEEGVTVLLTTQYLDEADALAHRIVVVDHGKVIADGTPLELKEESRSAHIEVTLAAPNDGAVGAIAPLVSGTVHVSHDGRQLSAGVDASAGLATAVVRALDAAGVLVDNIEVRQPSLDDVFFSLTGGHIEEGPIGEDGAVGDDDETGDGDAVGSDGDRADGKGGWFGRGGRGRGSRRSGGDTAGGGGDMRGDAAPVASDGREELEGARA